MVHAPVFSRQRDVTPGPKSSYEGDWKVGCRKSSYRYFLDMGGLGCGLSDGILQLFNYRIDGCAGIRKFIKKTRRQLRRPRCRDGWGPAPAVANGGRPGALRAHWGFHISFVN